MENLIVRLNEERNQLNTRFNSLTIFLSSTKYRLLDPIDQRLLEKQHSVMCDYLAILNTRIARIEEQK